MKSCDVLWQMQIDLDHKSNRPPEHKVKVKHRQVFMKQYDGKVMSFPCYTQIDHFISKGTFIALILSIYKTISPYIHVYISCILPSFLAQ